ncbi:hypothetical protein B4Q04_18335 [Zobellia sp. OII3]|uniref:hypothetical protein n=1 Tax=Zobellia sp. OII3 TaxID=2034520 RepID=UPI000B52F8B4|nr:hypothetical protein [Zobellia sp. OII3]OWW24062.1 hypothetical protein B4Q04_18335 [Zobellia sp. OII3]
MSIYINEKLLTGLRGDNFDDYFKMMFGVWLIKNSNEVVVDGEVLTGFRKNFGAVYGYKTGNKDGSDIKKPNSIIASGVSENGLELTDAMFVEIELKRVQNITDGLNDLTDFARRNYILFLNKKLNSSVNKAKDEKDEYWFIIGVKFATGEINQLLQDNEGNASKTAKELGNANYRPYISETTSDTNKISSKNIYNSRNKMTKIIEHCKNKNLEVTSDFVNRLPEE